MDHLSHRPEAGSQVAIAFGSSLGVVGSRHLAAPKDVEGCPENVVLQDVEVHMVVPTAVKDNVLLVLRPCLQCLPAGF